MAKGFIIGVIVVLFLAIGAGLLYYFLGMKKCKTNSDCKTGENCLLNKCVKIPKCILNSDCSSGEICSSGTCITKPCSINTDCKLGQVCSSGTCITDPLEGWTVRDKTFIGAPNATGTTGEIQVSLSEAKSKCLTEPTCVGFRRKYVVSAEDIALSNNTDVCVAGTFNKKCTFSLLFSAPPAGNVEWSQITQNDFWTLWYKPGIDSSKYKCTTDTQCAKNRYCDVNIGCTLKKACTVVGDCATGETCVSSICNRA